MPYYPTESAWTHAIQPPKPPKQARPSPSPPSSSQPRPTCLINANLRQATLSLHQCPMPPPPWTHSSPSHDNASSEPPFDFHAQSIAILNEILPPVNFGDPISRVSSTPSTTSSAFISFNTPKSSTPSLTIANA
ncbi:hypothetical protein BDR06DRAFT_1001430 [Suillus hirtellus]|nr:hypothetical protein BDR06DRAFT_1001430 [Suillus hirtellus]